MIRRTRATLLSSLAAGLLVASGCSFLDGDQPGASAPSSPTTSVTDEPSSSTGNTKNKSKKSNENQKGAKQGKKREGSSGEPSSPSPSQSAPAKPETDLGEPPTSYSEAAAHVNSAERSGQAKQMQRFESPDGNYHCVLDHEFIRPSCEIGDRSIRDADLCDGDLARYMGRIELTGGGWRPFCNSDTIREHGTTKLQVGSVAAWPSRGVSCVLEEIGVTCISSGRQGFFLGSGEYHVF